MAGFFLTTFGAAVVGAHVSPRAGARHGHARGLGVRLGDLAVCWCSASSGRC